MPAVAETLAGTSIESLEAMLDVTYTWGYQETRQKLRDLYDKAVRGQWISDDVLPWNQDVDLGKPLAPAQLTPLFGSDIHRRMTDAERTAVDVGRPGQDVVGDPLAAGRLLVEVAQLLARLLVAPRVRDVEQCLERLERRAGIRGGVESGDGIHRSP